MGSTSSVSSSERQNNHWFPSWFIWPLFVLTSSLRVFYVMQPRNWWLMHPDEIYQTMEVAHSEVYGFGFRAYEFNPKPVIDSQTPEIKTQELTHGMYALRSHLLPHAYVTVTWLLRGIGLDPAPFLTWKIFHTLVASTLILAVYRYVTVVFRSRDVACLAAILCAACAQLHVLGTHTLVNSLIAPPAFFVLSHLHTLFNPPEADDNSDSRNTEDQNKTTLNGTAGKAHGSHHKNSFRPNKVKPKSQKNGHKVKHISSSNGGPFNGSDEEKLSNGLTEKNNNSLHKSNGYAKKESISNGSTNGHAFRSKENKIETDDIHKNTATNKPNVTSLMFKKAFRNILMNLIAGFVIGLCVHIRVDIIALAAACLVTHWSPLRTRYFDVISCALGALCGVVFGILEDFRIYGWGVFTFYNWFRFNVQKDYSSSLFGIQESHKYIVDIFLHNFGMIVLSFLACACACCVSNSSSKSAQAPKGSRLTCLIKSRTFRSTVSWLLLLLLYSSKGHKELRFVHNVIVLVLVTCAASIQSFLSKSRLSFDKQRVVLAVGVVLFALSQWRDVTSLTDNPKRGGNKMAFKTAGDTQDVNQCLHRVSLRSDVTGVFIDRNLYATGGYTLLHKDVPVFSIFGYNFHEYNERSKVVEPTKTRMSPHSNMSVTYVGQFSNYVSLHNTQSVVKYVLQDRRYNYMVVMANRDFSVFGVGDPMFTCGTFKVYNRPSKPTAEQEARIQHTLSTKVSTNASILLHEADMLFFHGAWRRAEERFRLVLSVDPARVEAYLPLAASLFRQGDNSGYVAVMTECYEKFGKEACEMRRPLMTDVIDMFS